MQPSFFQKYKFTLISLFIIVLAAIPLLLLSNSANKKTATSPTPVATSPSQEPLSASNVEPTLSATDTQMQQTLNQADVDLKAAAQIDTTQDSTTGL